MTKTATPAPTTDALFDMPTDDAAAKVADHPAMSKWSSDLVRTLGNVWRVIQRRNPDVPDVVITIASGASRRGVTLGHFATNAWQNGKGKVHELMVGAEGLSRGPEDVLVTLLHEAAHGVCQTRIARAEAEGVENARKLLNDCSRQNRWHNDRFRANAVEIGLGYPTDIDEKSGKPVKPAGYATLGWSAATLTDETRVRYAKEIAALEKVMIASRTSLWGILTGLGDTAKGTGSGEAEDGEDGEKAKPAKTTLTAICKCALPRRIQKIARVVFEAATITCDACGEHFTEDVK